jgi:hypothetical protein
MARYLISFDDGAMDFIPEEEMPAVADAAHAVVDEAKDAGVWVFACPQSRRRRSWPPRSPSPAAVLKRSASSRPTRPWVTDRVRRPSRLGCARELSLEGGGSGLARGRALRASLDISVRHVIPVIFAI